MKYFLIFRYIPLILYGLFNDTNSSLLLENIEDKSYLNKYLANLLYKYEDFLIIFHVDLVTQDSVNNIVQDIYNKQTSIVFVVYNYDEPEIAAEFDRPEVPNVLHVLFAKNISYWYRLNSHNKIFFHDAIIFVTENHYLRSRIVEEKWKMIKLAGKVLLLESLENTTIHLFEICFYCGNMSKNFLLMEGNTTNVLLNNFEDLNGHLLNLVFIPNFPYLNCPKSEKQLWNNKEMNVCFDLNGFEGQMMQVISRKMNFKYMGIVLDINNTFIEMLKLVNSTKADIAFGAISLTLDRRPVIQFSTQFRFEAYTFVYRFSLSIVEIFENFVEPFQPLLVWILFLGILIFLSIMSYFILKVHKHTYVGQTTFAQTFWIFCHMPLEQSVQNINAVYRGLPTSGLVLTLWWLCCLVFCTMYKSMILSAMVHPANKEPEDLAHLLMVGYKIVGNQQSSDLINDLLTGDDPMYRGALEEVEYGINSCDAFAKVISKRAAMLEEQTMIQYGMRRKCSTSQAQVGDRLRIARYPVRFSGHAWAIQHGAPYRQAIDHYIGLILSGGLFEKWKRDATSRSVDKPIPLSREKRNKRAISVPLKALYPLFVIFVAGMLLSALCLLTEILYSVYRFNRRPSM